MYVRVGDVKKWIGRESSTMLEPPWPADLGERLDAPLAADPTGTVRVQNTGEGVLATVEGRATYRAECRRCLEPFLLTAPFSAEQEYREQEPGPDDAWLSYAGDVIPLDELVVDALCLAEPMAAVCRPDCQGLCPRCGKNLNEGACGCKESTDDRWSALQGWAPEAGADDESSDR